MLPTNLGEVTLKELQSLITNQVPEGKMIEYKRDTYRLDGVDPDKKNQHEELLKDVSSFANTLGGDLIVGIEEKSGVPISVCGFEDSNPDALKNRLLQIIQNGIEPRISCTMHALLHSPGRIVLIIRIPRSPISPHRVVFRNDFGQFFARNSAGTYRMDTTDLRQAFSLSETIYDKIKRFRDTRVTLIESGEMPMALAEGPKLICHLIPLESFAYRKSLEPTDLAGLFPAMPLLHESGLSRRFNVDGFLTFDHSSQSQTSSGYTQIFRNGIIESVADGITTSSKLQPNQLPAFYNSYIKTMSDAIDKFLGCMASLGITPPIWCFVSLTGMKGVWIGALQRAMVRGVPIDRDRLILPDIEITSYPTNGCVNLLRPVFDALWNAGGVERCNAYDTAGMFVGFQ